MSVIPSIGLSHGVHILQYCNLDFSRAKLSYQIQPFSAYVVDLYENTVIWLIYEMRAKIGWLILKILFSMLKPDIKVDLYR